MSEKALFGEQIAPHYEAWYETPEGRRVDALEKASLCRLLESFPHAQNVLEVGCGTGHFTRWLSEQGLAAVGLDLSAAMLAQAEASNGVLLVRGDALRLPFADGAFDLAAFITTLEFLERPREALAEALRVARQGLLLGVLSRWSLLGLQRRLVGLFRPTVYDAAHFYGVGELKHLLESVTGGKAHIVWHTTLFPRGWPWPQTTLPWGGFIGMASLVPERQRWWQIGSDGRDSHIEQIEGAGEITERSKRSSRDGRRIAFFTDQNGKWGLYVMNADGSDQCPMFETALDGLEFEYGFVPERMVSWTE